MSSGLFDLTGKVVLATGANNGLGLGFLRGCAKHGADVVVWGRRAEKNAEALEELKALGAGRVHAEAVDVADEAAVEAATASTLAAMGRIDSLFANAGIVSHAPSFMDMTSEQYHALLDVTLHGAFYTLRSVTRHMRDRALAADPGGSIVICGSLSLFHGMQGLEHYAAAKGALSTIMKGLAVEMGQYGVRANMLAVGFIVTGLMDGHPDTEGVVKHTASRTPLARVGELSDMEGPAVYLCSDASSFHSGDILVLDGGRSVNG
jgi:NAD(P)-dependent dehydrogenase (short-subunit alcohol dehydrogenase family)